MHVSTQVVKMRDRLIHLEAEIKDVGDRKFPSQIFFTVPFN